MVRVVGMTGNSRVFLLVGASLLMVSFAAMSTVSGSGWVIPMAALLSGILLILIFSFLTFTKEKQQMSAPIKSDKSRASQSIESEPENLPDPQNSGFDLPIM